MNKTQYEQKRFRNNFIFLALCAIIGFLLAEYLYSCGYFKGGYAQTELGTGWTAVKNMLFCCYDELKIFIIVFLFGFTVFSGIASALGIGYRGFGFGVALKIYSQCRANGSFTDRYYILMSVTSGIMLFAYLVLATKAMCYSSQIRYTGSDMKSVFSNKLTKNYTALFLLYTVIICICVVLRVYFGTA